MDPMSLIMFALIGVMIIFMIRNGKKRREQVQQMQDNMRPGTEVMLQSGIFGTIEEVDNENNRITVLSGTSTLVAHRSAVSQIVTPVDAPEELNDELAPDDDPAFGESVEEAKTEAEGLGEPAAEADGTDADTPESDKK